LALDFRRSHALDPRRVRRVTATVAPWAVPIVCEPVAEKTHPATTLQAIASLQFCVAAALTNGEVGIAALEPESRERPDICGLAERIEYRVADLPGFMGELALEMDDQVVRMSGTSPEATADRLKAKFIELAAHTLSTERIDPVLHAIVGLSQETRPTEFMRLLKS
jgi:hypothetical protein